MEEKILIQGDTAVRRNGLRYLWPAYCLWAVAFLYADVLYKMNVNGCSYAWTPDSCFPKWQYSFFEFLELSMGSETFFVSLTVLLWCAVLSLLSGVCLYCAFKNNEITVTNCRVYGKSAFGSQVQLPISSVIEAKGCPGNSVKIKLRSHSLLFGDIKNQKEVLRILEDNAKQQSHAGNASEVSEVINLESKANKLRFICFLPLFIFVILLAVGLYLNAEFCLEMYQRYTSIREQYGYLEYWLMWTLKKDPGIWIKFFFLLSLAGVYEYFAYRSSKLILNDGRILGRCKWSRHLDTNVNSVKGVSMGPLGQLTLFTDSGKFVFGSLKNRTAFYGYFDDFFRKACGH